MGYNVFVMNYSELKEQMGHLTGVVLRQLNANTEFSPEGICSVSYDDEGCCQFETHSIDGNYRRVEFIGTSK